MKLLIVGGTGVLSTAITNEALKQGFDVYMINRGNHMNLMPKNVHLLKADIKESNKIISLIGDLHFDAVVDCICYNIEQIDHSFNLFKDYVKQYIFISSCAVYNTQITKICKEDSPKILPIWDYSVDKNNCEEYLKKIAQKSLVNYTIIRPCVTYGNTRIPYGITPPYGYHWTLIERIMNNKPIITWNGGQNRCNITRVEDFAIGVVGLLGNEAAYNEAFNIAGEETPSWKEVLNILSDLLNKEVVTIDIPIEDYAKEIPRRKGELIGGRGIDNICSNEKIKKIIPSFKQSIPLKDGLKMTLDYYKRHNYIYGIDYIFDGDTDRIIAKYLKRKKSSSRQYNLKFVDYLGVSIFKEKLKYLSNRYKDNLIINLSLHLVSLMKRILLVINFH